MQQTKCIYEPRWTCLGSSYPTSFFSFYILLSSIFHGIFSVKVLYLVLISDWDKWYGFLSFKKLHWFMYKIEKACSLKSVLFHYSLGYRTQRERTCFLTFIGSLLSRPAKFIYLISWGTLQTFLLSFFSIWRFLLFCEKLSSPLVFLVFVWLLVRMICPYSLFFSVFWDRKSVV